MTTPNKHPADIKWRERALIPDRSFIVRAPAGSGKTELLTRRFLRLLATVNEPEEILAITFTRAATAEMRGRVLRELERGSRLPESPNEDEALQLARAVLRHSRNRRWDLLEQPHRLNIETIDSLCLRIAHNQPLLSRMGGALSPSEESGVLYREAARRTLGLLGIPDPELHEAIEHLLELRDNNLPECESLLAAMLQRRDQWIRAFPLAGDMGQDEWEQARSYLEQPFRDSIKRIIRFTHRIFMREPLLVSEMLHLAHYACANGNSDVASLSGLNELGAPDAMTVDHWHSISDFLLTKGGDWRQPGGLNKNCGFPATTSAQKEMKKRMGDLLVRFQQIHGLGEALCGIRELPKPRYEEQQWTTLRHIFIVLRRAVAELRVLFAQRNSVDFIETNIAAQQVLRTADPDTMLALSGGVRHVLVDEFQDTSRAQHDLLCLLIRAWEQSEGRTCFLVGDPMQSIYLFRQAEVELFAHVAAHGLVSPKHSIELEPLALVSNFRSHAGLATRWNDMFSAIFARNSDSDAAHVAYSHTIAEQPEIPGGGVFVYPQLIGNAEQDPTPSERSQARRHEAERVVEIIESHSREIEEARLNGGRFQIAVLVRTRAHLAQISPLLRERRIAYRAVEIETLNQHQELIDLMSLTRALLHPMDRTAWLATLRAPWCGLTLEDLHTLAGADDPAFRYLPVLDLIEQRLPLLSMDGQARLKRVSDILNQALSVRFSGNSLSQWIERTWRSLGGHACLDAEARENAEVFFAFLDKIAPDGISCLAGDFEAQMNRLFAHPDPRASERAGVQLMTIHKAKGLGFDVVIVPGLDRKPRHDESPLVFSLQRTGANGETELLVAPIGYREDDKHPTYAWVQKQAQSRSNEELRRVLYVACTRARRSLHLLGTAKLTKAGPKPEHGDSLLAAAWPALASDFERSVPIGEDSKTAELIQFPSRPMELAGLDLAAAGTDPEPTLRLRRLSANPDLSASRKNISFVGGDAVPADLPPDRPQGSRDARNKGNVVHALLQQLSSGTSISAIIPQARTLLRAAAYSGKALEEAEAEVVTAIRNCLGDADGAWILAPHAGARSESSWTGWRNGSLETIRADRVFLAGSEPRAPGEDHFWIIDYKMSAPAGNTAFLEKERNRYAPQLARYAHALREAEGITLPIRFGLYYPRIARLDWWAEEQ